MFLHKFAGRKACHTSHTWNLSFMQLYTTVHKVHIFLQCLRTARQTSGLRRPPTSWKQSCVTGRSATWPNVSTRPGGLRANAQRQQPSGVRVRSYHSFHLVVLVSVCFCNIYLCVCNIYIYVFCMYIYIYIYMYIHVYMVSSLLLVLKRVNRG